MSWLVQWIRRLWRKQVCIDGNPAFFARTVDCGGRLASHSYGRGPKSWGMSW